MYSWHRLTQSSSMYKLDSIFRVLEPVNEKITERASAPSDLSSKIFVRNARSEWFKIYRVWISFDIHLSCLKMSSSTGFLPSVGVIRPHLLETEHSDIMFQRFRSHELERVGLFFSPLLPILWHPPLLALRLWQFRKEKILDSLTLRNAASLVVR